MIEKGIRGGICHALYRYVRTNNKYLKDYDKNEWSSYLNIATKNYLSEVGYK